jgi:ribosomal protein S14
MEEKDISAIHLPAIRTKTPAWNKCRIIGQKRPLLSKHVWAIRVRLKVRDVFASGHVMGRASFLDGGVHRPRLRGGFGGMAF